MPKSRLHACGRAEEAAAFVGRLLSEIRGVATHAPSTGASAANIDAQVALLDRLADLVVEAKRCTVAAGAQAVLSALWREVITLQSQPWPAVVHALVLEELCLPASRDSSALV